MNLIDRMNWRRIVALAVMLALGIAEGAFFHVGRAFGWMEGRAWRVKMEIQRINGRVLLWMINGGNRGT